MTSPHKYIVDTLLRSTELVDAQGRTVSVGGAKVLVLYFSAHWCPPCRQFTPRLRDIYQEYTQALGTSPRKVQVVFVSGDRTLEDMYAYMREAHGNWPAVPPGTALQHGLNSAFEVRGIPCVIVVDSNGEMISREGRNEILNLGAAAFVNWHEQFTDIDTSIVETLKENPPEVMKEAAQILIKLLGNVIRDPQNLKFRSIRLSNPTIESKLLVAVGAFEILFSVGFEEGTDSLVLPFNASLKYLEAFKKAIENVLTDDSSNPTAQASAKSDSATKSTAAPAVSSTFAPATPPSQLSVPVSNAKEQQFLSKLISEYALAFSYEDPQAQAEALKVIPIERLEAAATKKMEESNSSSGDLFREFLLVELMHWFKNEFFTWVDSPACSSCQGQTSSKGYGSPTQQELADGASRIELYSCNGCGKEERFPRYHSKPTKLLSTRRGRCGEYANCFALILRAMGYDTRRVLDWTDHVWCEVFSQTEKRWLHVDTGEETVDKPLIYEKGWGKKLTYIIATSKDEVQDVSWRYSVDHKALRGRRLEVNEQWLTQTLLKLTEQCQKHLSEDQKKKLTERRLLELVELISTPNKKVTEDELKGRITGSLAWRLARGEQGSTSAEAGKGYTWKLTEAEKESKIFHLEYDVVTDQYTRVSNNNELSKSWQSGVSNFQNIFRKEEKDWKKVYLARTEDSDKSSISWTLDLSDTDLSVKSVELDVESNVYQTGRIVWQLCGGTICLLPLPGTTLKSEGLSGSKKLTLSAMMSGGSGDVSWQHTQLFRSDVEATPSSQLRIIVKLQ